MLYLWMSMLATYINKVDLNRYDFWCYKEFKIALNLRKHVTYLQTPFHNWNQSNYNVEVDHVSNEG